MSIIIGLCKNDYVAVCSDCQHTNIRTGKPGDLDLPKIEMISEKLFIAHGGSSYIAGLCMLRIKRLFKSEDLLDDSIVDVTYVVSKLYEIAIQDEPELHISAPCKFMVVGDVGKNTKGLGIVEYDGSNVTTRIIEGLEEIHIEIFSPPDVSLRECYTILTNAFMEYKNVPFYKKVKKALCETVKRVSQKSTFVNEEYLYYDFSK